MAATSPSTGISVQSLDPLARPQAGALGNVREQLQSAFRLAYFIHSDRELAIKIAKEALDDLEAAKATQRRRLYYTPSGLSSGRAKPQTPRTKVVMADAHLLQRLVYRASEIYEIQQEKAQSEHRLTEEDMLIRFVKHLVRITVRRSSFYVALGISRLLHGYSTTETMDIYTAVVQDPGRVKEDSYYRAGKRELMSELEERFGKFLRRTRAPRGEERFAEEENAPSHLALVRECLSVFTPWETSCVGAEAFERGEDQLSHLAFDGEEPDTEHPIEMNRMHAITHPECYEQVAASVGLDKPESRLSLPQFQIDHSNDRRPPIDRHRPLRLTEEEMSGLLGEVDRQADRRRRISARHLSILVDGTRIGEFDGGKGNRLRLELGESSELIEVRAWDKEGYLKVGAVLLSCADRSAGRTSEHTIVADGGQKITFSLSFRKDPSAEPGDGVIEVAVDRAPSVRAAWQELREAAQTLREESSQYVFKDVSRNRTPLLGMRARGDQEVLRLADEQPMNYAELSEALIRGAISAAVLKKVADRLVTLAGYAHAFRRMDDLGEISRLLIALPLTWQYEQIGYYYLALATKRCGEGDFAGAARLLERVAENASPIYRVRAVQSLGASAVLESKYDFGLKLFGEASRLATRECVFDPAIMVSGQQNVAATRVLAGDYHQALTVLLENVLPTVGMIGGSQAHAYDSYVHSAYLNTLAVLLGKAGRLDEAEQVCHTLSRSPLASVYSHFYETKKELELRRGDHATRSRVALGG